LLEFRNFRVQFGQIDVSWILHTPRLRFRFFKHGKKRKSTEWKTCSYPQ